MLEYTADELESMIRERMISGRFIDMLDKEGYCEKWEFIVGGCRYEAEYSLFENATFETQIARAIKYQLEQEYRERMEKDDKMEIPFSRKELLLLYDACLCYRDTLTEANKKIYGCPDETKGISRRAEESSRMAVRLAEALPRESEDTID